MSQSKKQIIKLPSGHRSSQERDVFKSKHSSLYEL